MSANPEPEVLPPLGAAQEASFICVECGKVVQGEHVLVTDHGLICEGCEACGEIDF